MQYRCVSFSMRCHCGVWYHCGITWYLCVSRMPKLWLRYQVISMQYQCEDQNARYPELVSVGISRYQKLDFFSPDTKNGYELLEFNTCIKGPQVSGNGLLSVRYTMICH